MVTLQLKLELYSHCCTGNPSFEAEQGQDGLKGNHHSVWDCVYQCMKI